MKKIIFILTLMMSLTLTVNAQSSLVDNGGVKDNWYIGGTVGTNVWNDVNSWTMFNTKSVVSDGKTNSWWRTQPLNISVLGGKMFNPYMGFEVDYRTVYNLRGETPFLDAHNLTANVVVNLTNTVYGYIGARKMFELELLGGAGWVHNFSKTLVDGTPTPRNAMSVRGAVRGNLNLNNNWAVTVTPEYIWIPRNVGTAMNAKQGVNVSVGVKYRFNSLRGHFPNRKLYDQAEIDDLNEIINGLKIVNKKLTNTNADLVATIKDLIAKGEKVIVKTEKLDMVFFEQGKSEVNYENVKHIIDALKEHSGSITLVGNTSPEGSEYVNDTLAKARAEQVKQMLVKHGIDESRVNISNNYEDKRCVLILVE